MKFLLKIMTILSFLSATASKPLDIDECLNIEHVKLNYHKCCVNNGFKIEGRKNVCKQAGEHVKRRL